MRETRVLELTPRGLEETIVLLTFVQESLPLKKADAAAGDDRTSVRLCGLFPAASGRLWPLIAGYCVARSILLPGDGRHSRIKGFSRKMGELVVQSRIAA
jgi:hypothetical protein